MGINQSINQWKDAKSVSHTKLKIYNVTRLVSDSRKVTVIQL